MYSYSVIYNNTFFIIEKSMICICQNKSQVFTSEIESNLNTEYVFVYVEFTFVNASLDSHTVRSLTIPTSDVNTAR